MPAPSWIRSLFGKSSAPIRKSQTKPAGRRLDVVELEDRSTPATASQAGGVLSIDFVAANESVTVSNTAGTITVSGNASGTFTGVDKIAVTDSGAAGSPSRSTTPHSL